MFATACSLAWSASNDIFFIAYSSSSQDRRRLYTFKLPGYTVVIAKFYLGLYQFKLPLRSPSLVPSLPWVSTIFALYDIFAWQVPECKLCDYGYFPGKL